jgi:hypothetical protein
VGLSMAERQAVTRETAARYRRSLKTRKKIFLDELCALAGIAITLGGRCARWPVGRSGAAGSGPASSYAGAGRRSTTGS